MDNNVGKEFVEQLIVSLKDIDFICGYLMEMMSILSEDHPEINKTLYHHIEMLKTNGQ